MNAGATAGAGLGIFFVGMRLVSAHLREMASGGIRKILTSALHRPGVAPLTGLLAGALTQSTSAVTFIATGLVSAGAMPLAVAVPMLAWANAGTSALVLLATLNVHVIALYLLMAVGFGFFNALDQGEKSRHLVYALLGLGLLLYGLTLVKGAVAEVRDDFWVREFVEFAGSNTAVSLLTGFVLAIALQSSSVVTVLALPLAAQGLVSVPGMCALIVGACAGSGTAVVLVSSGLEGPARQLAVTQGMVRGLASLAALPVVIAANLDIPVGLEWLSERLHGDLGSEVGIVFLLVQLVGIGLAWALLKPILGIAAVVAPPTPAESLAKPAYIYDEAAADPGTALELVRLEHTRLVKALADHLEDLRDPAERNPEAPPLKDRAAASGYVLACIEEFLTEISAANPEMAPDAVFDARRRLGDLKALQRTVSKFAFELAAIPPSERPPFVRPLVEGLHALFVVVGEACDGHADDARALLLDLTAERGSLVDRVRRELLAGSPLISGRESVLSVVLLLERILWMLRERSPLPSTPGVTGEDALVMARSDSLG